MNTSRESGVTLIELVVVVSIVSILMVALGFSYYGWQGRYKVESSVKDLYTDLINTRARAMQRNRIHWVRLIDAKSYTAYDDDSDGTAKVPDGDGTLQPGTGVSADTEIGSFPKTLEYDMDWRTTGAPADDDIEFDRKGVAVNSGTICFFTDTDDPDKESDFNPDYDCIIVSATRINLGKLQKQDTDGGVCKSLVNGGHCEAL